MGCDIHIAIEAKEHGKWSLKFPALEADGYEVDYKWPHEFEPHEENSAEFMTSTATRTLTMRWYALFARLAGVRNYESCVPLSPPRGIPADASDDCRRFVASWDGDGHSHSHMTVKELCEGLRGEFDDWLDALNYMLALYAPNVAKENVRLIFFFDN